MKKHAFLITVLLCLLIFASLGVCASVLSERCGMRLDLTEEKLYTLSDETDEVLSSLAQPVTITVYNRSTDFPAIVRNLLERYETFGAMLDVEYRDPYTAPRELRELQGRGYEVDENSIVVRSGENVRVLTVDELYELDESGSKVKRLTAEQKLTSAVDAVVRGERGTVLFMDGHGEEPSNALIELFELNQYKTAYAELSVVAIEEDTVLIVICAPKRDATAEEIALLEEYMARGGAVLCFMEPGSSGLLHFAEFLEERGIGLTDAAVSEPQLYISDNPMSIVATYAGHEINSYFANDRRYVVVPSCSAVEQLYIKQGRGRTQQVLRTSSAAYTLIDDIGTRNLCVSAERTSTGNDGNEVSQRLVVFGSKLIYSDDLLGEGKLANRDFLVQTVSYLVGEEPLLSIPAKELTVDILPVTAQTARLYAGSAMIALPVLILLAGLGVCIRRRYL